MEIFIFLENINKLNRNEIAKLHHEISFVDENSNLIYNLGVKENIILPLISMNKRKDEIEIAVNELVAWLNIEKILDKNIFNLSMSEQKIVHFASAIISRPRILLLDNFFTNLDLDIQKKISYLLLALKKIGTTIITFNYDNNSNLLEFNQIYKIINSSLVKL